MVDQAQNINHTFDLSERTAVYAENVIDLVKQVRVSAITRRLIDQVVGASSSIAANYCEADEAESKKAFRNHINRCRKEAKESCLFLRLIARAAPEHTDAARQLWQEGHELTKIYAAINRSVSDT